MHIVVKSRNQGGSESARLYPVLRHVPAGVNLRRIIGDKNFVFLTFHWPSARFPAPEGVACPLLVQLHAIAWLDIGLDGYVCASYQNTI